MDFRDFLTKIDQLQLLDEAKKKESTAEKDDKAEKAGKKVTKDIEADDKKDKKKKSLKDWFEQLDKELLAEAEQIQILPAKQTTSVIKQGDKTLGSVSNPQLAQQIKQSIGKGEMSLAGTEIKEDDIEESGLQAYLGNKKYGKAGMDALRKAGREGASKEKMAQIRAKHDKLDEKAVSKKQQKFMGMVHAAQKGEKAASPEVAKVAKSMKKSDVKDFAKTKHKGLPEKKKKVAEADRPLDGDQLGPGSHSPRSDKVLEAKPDFLDFDKDGNKKESMKKALADKKKKKKVDESMNHKCMAARLRGKAHALAKESYNNKFDEGSDEHGMYHEGYKEGLDECYGMGGKQVPVQGLVVGETEMPATVPGMASQAMSPAMEADMDEGNAFTGKLASTPKGGSFELDGQKYKDTSSIEENDVFAFESLDRQLSDLLNEGISVNMSQGLESAAGGGGDSVSVTATDDDAAKLLDFIKQVGLGGLGSKDEVGNAPAEVVAISSDYGAPKFSDSGSEDMAALMKKVGVDDAHDDYKDEGGEDHKEGACEACGMTEADCGCEKEKMDEVESEEQMEYEVAEDSAGQDEEAMTTADEKSEAEEDLTKPASGGAMNEGGDGGEASEESDGNTSGDAGEGGAEDVDESEKLDEWANDAGGKGTDAAFEADIEFMTNVISSGLNKKKSTGQTTIPVIAGQGQRTGVSEDSDLVEFKRLAGL